MADTTSVSSAKDRRWLILGVIGLAQLMVVLDLTVMNIALPSAQQALHFTTADRQWVVTAYSLAFGSLLLAGATLETKRKADPLLSREALQFRVPDYTAGQDAALGLISPIFADLSGLPPLIIQAGTHEVLLDDAIRLAQQAATADGEVTLDITPGVPHVFQGLLPDPRRGSRGAGQSGTVPVSAPRQCRTRRRVAKGSTRAARMTQRPLTCLRVCRKF